MKTLSKWIEEQMNDQQRLINEMPGGAYSKTWHEGFWSGMGHVLKKLKARGAAEKKQGSEVPAPSGPGRFTNRIADLRRDLAVAGDADERSKISQELLDAEDDYREYTGISRREEKMTEADHDFEIQRIEDEKENE